MSWMNQCLVKDRTYLIACVTPLVLMTFFDEKPACSGLPYLFGSGSRRFVYQ